MKLRRIWAISRFLITASASIVKDIRLANETTSDRTPSLLLVANLEAVNTTHVNVSITNTYPQQISILKWNSLFQTNQNAAHGSFQLRHRFLNGSTRTVRPGYHMGRYRYMDPTPSHYFNISAGATYADIFDITNLFNVPDDGTYDLTIDFTRTAVPVPNGVDLSRVLGELKRNLLSLPAARVKSDTVSVDLQASSPSHITHKRDNYDMCTSQTQSSSAVLRARGHARSLAKFAQEKALPPLGIAAHGLVDKTLWVQYFKNDTAAKNVSSIYNAISSYGIRGQTGGITEFCDLHDTDHMCTDDGGAISYSTFGTPSTGPSVTFCSPFFTLPVAHTCSAPGFYNNLMTDQGGIYLHELAKSQQLTGVANVTDGFDDDCWTWDCITSAAANLNGEKAWLLAGAYELFAYASRAELSHSCPKAKAVGPQSQPSPPGGPPDEQRLPGVQRPPQGMPDGGLREGAGTDTGDPRQEGSESGNDVGNGSGGGAGGAGVGNGGTGG